MSIQSMKGQSEISHSHNSDSFSLVADYEEADTENVIISQQKTFKYKAALKSLIPFRPSAKSKHPNDQAGLFSIITFFWLSALVCKIFKKPPKSEDLWEISEYDETKRNYKRLVRIWKQEVKEKGFKDASIHRVVWKFVRTRMLISTSFFFLFGVAIFLSSGIIIRQLLQYVSRQNGDLHYGFVLIAFLFSAELFRALMLTGYFVLNYRTAVRTRAAVLLLIFKKVIKTHSISGKTSVGELVTMCSNDGDRLFEACRAANAVILGPSLFIVGTVYTWYLLGAISLIGSLVFIVIILLQAVIVKVMNKLRMKAILSSEERIKKLNEIFSAIKMIKMYAWESFFIKLIESIREKELAALQKAAVLQSINVSCAFLTPVFASVLMISAFVLLKNSLTPELAFTAIALYNAIANALKFMPIAVKSLADANVSLNRFKNLLAIENVPHYVNNQVKNKKNVIEVQDVVYAWGTEENTDGANDSPKHDDLDVQFSDQNVELLNTSTMGDSSQPVLKNINFHAQKGQLVGIFGAVGSGKSSFISGLMGQLCLRNGRVAVAGSVAYCAQQAWLMNATIRNNILFGFTYNKEKYQDVVTSCELLQDFEMFQSGDLTEVGERGINLSGGQKQRISLARALYSDKDIYLLDDPMSALDAHVGKSIFSEVMLQRLKNCGKTVVLVTHQIQYLSHCDVVYEVKNSTLTQVDAEEAENLNQNIKTTTYATDKDDSLEFENDDTLPELVTLTKAPSTTELDLELQGKLLTTEESGKGIPRVSYAKYVNASGGYIAAVFMGLFFIVNVGAQHFSNFWLSYWLNQGSGNFTPVVSTGEIENENISLNLAFSPVDILNSNKSQSFDESNDILLNPSLNFYLTVYGLSALLMFIVSVIRGFAFVSMTIRASRVLHRSLFNSVIQGSMSFFDTTPTGRILNRFQKDTDEQDVLLPFLLEMFLFNVASFLLAVGLVAYVFPKFLVVIGVIFPIFLIIYIIFKPSARELRRLDALTRSPWFAHIATVVTGLDTLRAYNRTKDFIQKFCELLDANGVPCYLFACVNRWLAFRLDLLTIAASVVISVLVVANKDLVSPAYAGLALSSSFFMSGMLQFTIRMLIESEARLVCVDRIRYYIDNTPQENKSSTITPKSNWPQNGKIEFKNVSMRYRDELPLVLKNLTFTLAAGEKIGVVGRTGSGKSSLSVALFRLTELASGSILIDDLDISALSLHKLRSQLSIIPQDPVLFSGTIRYNLDPFNQYSDSDLWSALKQAHLKESVSKLTDHLDEAVLENGSNFSVGERQLICLARALLRNSKVLILDEATAAVDMETEKIVHEVIDDLFAQCTVITIAHRLSTVTKSDRIMVLDQGVVAEFDTPQKLLDNESSVFYNMLKTFNDSKN